MTVPLPPANGVWPPSGQVKFSVPLSVVNTTMVSFVDAHVLELLHDRADDVVELGHSGFVQSTSRSAACAVFSYFSERWVTMCMRVGFSQRKNGLPSPFALSRNLNDEVEDLVVHGLHPFRVERAGVLDLLLADLAPARLLGRVVLVGRPGVDHVARADLVLELRRVVGMGRVLHRVQVIEVAEELVEAVDGRQELVEVAQVVLAELAGGVAHRLKRRGDGRRLRPAGRSWHPPGRPWSCRCGSGAGR